MAPIPTQFGILLSMAKLKGRIWSIQPSNHLVGLKPIEAAALQGNWEYMREVRILSWFLKNTYGKPCECGSRDNGVYTLIMYKEILKPNNLHPLCFDYLNHKHGFINVIQKKLYIHNKKGIKVNINAFHFYLWHTIEGRG